MRKDSWPGPASFFLFFSFPPILLRLLPNIPMYTHTHALSFVLLPGSSDSSVLFCFSLPFMDLLYFPSSFASSINDLKELMRYWFPWHGSLMLRFCSPFLLLVTLSKISTSLELIVRTIRPKAVSPQGTMGTVMFVSVLCVCECVCVCV